MENIAFYSKFRQPQVRALVWSLLSPGLVPESSAYQANVTQQWCQDLYQQLEPVFLTLDNDPQPLIDWLAKYKSWRLGIRFEAYWSFILSQLESQGNLAQYAAHIQVNDQIRQTRGEMDFVYIDNAQKLTHLELAVKFYLLKPDEFGFERLVGPNGQDWYERKLEHLFKKQLPLSKTEDAQKKIAETFELSPDNLNCLQQGLIKGMIFLPIGIDTDFNNNEKQILNMQCQYGLWATIDNWYLADPGEIGRWVMLDKLDWLVPQVYSSLEEELYTAKEMAYKLKIHFHKTKRSVLIVRLDYDEQDKIWLEQQRVMVVDHYWPSYKKMTIKQVAEFSELGKNLEPLNETNNEHDE